MLLTIVLTAVLAAAACVGAPRAVCAQAQTKEQRKCTAAMAAALRTIAATAAKDASACLTDGAKSALSGTIDVCVSADRAGKVAAAVADSDAAFEKLCTGTGQGDPPAPKQPPYGVTDAATMQGAALVLRNDLLHDLFGPDLDAAIAREASDKERATCQRSLAKRAGKCAAAALKEFTGCAVKGLKNKESPFDDAEDLAGCLGADPKQKIAKQCDLDSSGKVDGIRKTLDKKCVGKGVGLVAALPGCGVPDAEEAHACMADAVDCRACLALNRAGDLTRDCDLFDDGLANASCVAPIGRHQCLLSPDSGMVFETSEFFQLLGLSGAIRIDCGTVDAMTGRTACTCTLDHIDPIPILSGLGVACIRAATGCPAGEISCAGGALYNSAITSHHSIGTCTGNSDCAAQCATRCSADAATVFDSACEGFCRGGSNAGAVCTSDAACTGGTCNGPNGAGHGNVCQCECLDTAGAAGLAGGMHCNLGVAVDVEADEPCGDGDVLFQIGDRCVPFTTEATQAVIVDANNVSGEQIPTGVDIYAGLPIACSALADVGASGLALASRVNVFDVQNAGDTALAFVLACQ